ncbi:isocitrate lyase/PEP mutase family protein [Parasulfitobacter algicola]|uniref:Isocitrate lyase/phosphoenolpyruvate mutase family protein n=1 Tax=Parasulfitobacter algicola TaxID=2614809 RepID=A0ABX2IT53_9RHOB|nr:isocitrate lyase/phosphoenolpyruvate mutase family protein [Sulfitobacter algicola]NSX55505.1 isocitrate lyase/phosphoenolpyruvate mutase family protein [Sulfitobacter algicola]
MTKSQQEKFDNFKALHDNGQTFVIPNAWDAGSSRILTHLGFIALATTSAGYAFSIGRRDAIAGLSRDEILTNAKAIVDATDLPVSADLEDGFGSSPDACAETIRQACDIGLVGGSIEDASGDPDTPIFDMGLSVDRIQAAVDAAKDRPFLLTARAENFLYSRPDLDDTIKRLQAFENAGADVLYAPGLPDLDAIKTVCAAVSKPVNVVMGLSGGLHSVADLAKAGVTRISVGGSFARAAWAGMIRAAEEVRDHGTFTYAQDAIPDGVISQMMSDERRR